MAFERDNIARLHAYLPGEQPDYTQTGSVLKLNTNENPYPPSPNVMDAIRGLTPEALRLYPPADAVRFRRAAADLHGLTPGQVIATNGGDELLRLLVTVFCAPRNGAAAGIGMTAPSYTLYSVLADIQDTPITIVERGEGFALPDDYADRLNAAGCRLAFLVNPHAPTGRFETVARVREMARTFRGVFVVDEAYADFAPGDALGLLRGDDALPNVVILRSLSKGYGLAGLRFGYGLADAGLIATLDKARDSYNTDILSQVAAVAALEDQAYFQETCAKVIAERDRLTQALRKRGFDVPESYANFVLAAAPPGGPAAEAIYQHLKANRILIRYFNQPRLEDKLRITVGTPQQNDALLAQLDALVPAA